MPQKKVKPNAFLKKKKRTRKESLVRPNKIQESADLPPYIVKGRVADSKDEYWAALALERIEKIAGYRWAYQVPVNGGRSRPGGNVVDFLVYTPRWTIIDPMGRPFHTGKNEDRLEMEEVARNNNWNLIAYFTDEPHVLTKELVYTYLKSQLHV